MLRREAVGSLPPKGLAALLKAVTDHRVTLTAADLYRICALCKDADTDTLSLGRQSAFMQALAQQYKLLSDNAAAAPISPFQDALLKETLAAFPVTGPTSEVAATLAAGKQASPPRSPSALGEPTVEERLSALWEIFNESRVSPSSSSGGGGGNPHDVTAGDEQENNAYAVTSSTIQLIETHVCALEKQLRQLSPINVSQLIKVLATINYNNYHHTSLLSRRGCEVIGDLPLTEACRVFFNLHKLKTHDSLQAIVNRIQSQMKDLSAQDVFLVAQSLERQMNTSSASAGLISALATQGVAQLPHAKSPTYHRALLVAIARYNVRHHPAVPALLNDLAERTDRLHERDLLSILQALCELEVSLSGCGGAGTRRPCEVTPACMAALLKRVETTVPSMGVRNLDSLMDVLSLLPGDSTKAMQAIMNRLDADAGKLTLPQLDVTLRLLSTYPPAKGHLCVVSLGFAAALRATSMEATTLESVVVSLAALRHFTDDFYTLAEVLLGQKGGFRRACCLFSVAENGPPPSLPDPRFASLVHRGVLGLAPSLNEAELAQCKELLQRYATEDKDAMHRVQSRVRQLQRGGRGGSWTGPRKAGKRPYDPMADFIE